MKFGTLATDKVWRLKELEVDKQRLKKLVAERDLEIGVMKEIAAKMVGVQARRTALAYATDRGVS